MMMLIDHRGCGGGGGSGRGGTVEWSGRGHAPARRFFVRNGDQQGALLMSRSGGVDFV